jgi:YD repeat-containing protein
VRPVKLVLVPVLAPGPVALVPLPLLNGYDSIYELLSLTQNGSTTESYTYDPVGNLLSNLSGSGWSYNTSNGLNSRPSYAYTYDYNGNTTSKTDSTGTTTYTWDFENRLTSVTLPGSGGSVTFKYDPFGRRIYKSSSSGTSVYAYGGPARRMRRLAMSKQEAAQILGVRPAHDRPAHRP